MENRAAGVALVTYVCLCLEQKRISLNTCTQSLCLLLFVFVFLCVCSCKCLSGCYRVSTGHLTAAPHCPHACRWSRVRVQRSVCSLHCPTLTLPSARWRATWGPDSCVMSYWLLETDGYLLTGRSKETCIGKKTVKRCTSLGLQLMVILTIDSSLNYGLDLLIKRILKIWEKSPSYEFCWSEHSRKSSEC